MEEIELMDITKIIDYIGAGITPSNDELKYLVMQYKHLSKSYGKLKRDYDSMVSLIMEIENKHLGDMFQWYEEETDLTK